MEFLDPNAQILELIAEDSDAIFAEVIKARDKLNFAIAAYQYDGLRAAKRFMGEIVGHLLTCQTRVDLSIAEAEAFIKATCE